MLEEGIEDIQNLATANLVDVMLNTRIPLERLVDWIDQSLLYLHLGPRQEEKSRVNREKLHRFGIRAATDLVDAFDVHSGDQDWSEEDAREHIKRLEFVLNDDEKGPSVLRTVLATLKNDPNYHHIKNWKDFPTKILSVEGSGRQY